MAMRAQFIISGQLPSIKNRRRLVLNKKTGRYMFIKSKECMDYAKSFHTQLPKRYRIGYEKPIELDVLVYYQSWRSDLDVELVKDLLQETNVISNDRQVFRQTSEKRKDPSDPRVIITITPYEPPLGPVKPG